MAPTLLSLPSELLISILQLAITPSRPTHYPGPSTPPPTIDHIRQLHILSRTCRFLYHFVTSPTSDRALWHPLAVSLGIPASIPLDSILYAGTSAPQTRRWSEVVKLNYLWALPFPGTPALPKAHMIGNHAAPPVLDKGRRKTIELCVAGLGAQGPVFETAGVFASDRGTAWVKSEHARWCVDLDAGDKPAGGYSVSHGEVREYSAEKTNFKRWDLGRMEVEQFRILGSGLLVALGEEDGDGDGEKGVKKLVCVDAERRLWELDIDRDWQDMEDDYERWCKISSFCVSSTTIVCLVLRAPDKTFAKLTRLEFRVVNVRTGELEGITGFGNGKLSSHPHPGIQRRGNLTSVLDFPFLITDKYIISGWQGGELRVVDYRRFPPPTSYGIPLYLPLDENDPNSFLHTFSAITLSADGRYLGATTAKELFVVDMVEKKVVGRYGNGRRGKGNLRNPQDGFPSGIWCVWKEWKYSEGRSSSSSSLWEEVGMGVVYKQRLLAGRPTMATASQKLEVITRRHRWLAYALVCILCWQLGGTVWLVMAFVGSVTSVLYLQL
ncbi:hypothetical protein FN846DRAFT_950701 [Sphaerosporella brunnea]|uniref:F-box domain-containing protein n=1 Tax=Sphaerosporella brunnea TaxID=1250544 RepID=A0A5J5EVH9_9PEZI|nr:hypothetical protein FN846DRAFT_950701 [Sphaerosporella brunnea]